MSFVDAEVVDENGKPFRKEGGMTRVYESFDRSASTIRMKFELKGFMYKAVYNNKKGHLITVKAGEKFDLSDVQGRKVRVFLHSWKEHKQALRAQDAEKPPAAPPQKAAAATGAANHADLPAKKFEELLNKAFKKGFGHWAAMLKPDNDGAASASKADALQKPPAAVLPNLDAEDISLESLSPEQRQLYESFVEAAPAGSLNGRSKQQVLIALIVRHNGDKQMIAHDITKWHDGELDLDWLVAGKPQQQKPKKPDQAPRFAPLPHAQFKAQMESLLTRAADQGDETALAQISEIIKLLDCPATRQRLMYKQNKWVVIEASPCRENLCWLSSTTQAYAGQALQETELKRHRKIFQSFCGFLLETFDEDNLKRLFFERDAAGVPTGSQDADEPSQTSILATLKRRKIFCDLMGGNLELRFLATFFLAEIHVHTVALGGVTASGAAPDASSLIRFAGAPETIHIITPLGMQRGAAGRVLHIQHLMPVQQHFRTILGVAGSFKCTDPAARDPQSLLEAARNYVTKLAEKCSPDALSQKFGDGFSDAKHHPIRTGKSQKASSVAVDLTDGADGGSSKHSASEPGTQQTIQQQISLLASTVQAQQQQFQQMMHLMQKLLPQSDASSATTSAPSAALSSAGSELSSPCASSGPGLSSASSAGSSSDAGLTADSNVDSSTVSALGEESSTLLGGGEVADPATLSTQLDAALAALNNILRGSSNDVYLEHFLGIESVKLVGTENGERESAISHALEAAKPVFESVIAASSQGGKRTKLADKFLNRLLTCAAGHISIDGLNDPPAPESRINQLRLLEQYAPLMQALFPPSKFKGFTAHVLTNSSLFDQATASAILTARQ